ncbi:MAG: AraC family transcriptional regulator [Gammaproteobacteria bacterium]
MAPAASDPAEPAQLAHERDRLGFVPLALAGRHTGSHGIAALYAGTVRDVRKHAYPDFHTLTFALGGDALTCVDPGRGVQAEMGAGTVTVQPADVESIWRSRGPARWLQFYLSTSLVIDCARDLGVTAPERLSLARRPAIDSPDVVRVLYACARRLADGSAAESAALDDWSRMLAESLVRAHLLPRPPRAAACTAPLSPARVDAARAYIAAHLGPGLTATAVAEALGLSRFHFTRGFAAATGETPYQVIQRERLRAARRLVTGTARPLADIASDLGYAHQGHMSVAFTQALGISPAKVRMLARGARTGGHRSPGDSPA